ncbi:MAG: hypothetical protein ACTSV2_11685 [Candidatus Thorarchaeota archaeon]
MTEMFQKRQSTNQGYVVDSISSLKKIKVTILTSKKCFFCDVAVSHAREAADNLSKFNYELEIVESSIDDNPSIIEELNVLGLPLTIIGKAKFLGIPNVSDIEEMVHQVLLAV